MEKQTVRDKIMEIVDYLEGDDFNVNVVIDDSMTYASNVSPIKFEHEHLDYYTYLVVNKTLEKVINVLHCEAEAGRYSFITDNPPPSPKIKIGDVRNVIYDDEAVKMRLNHILSGDRKTYVFTNCDQGKFVRPLVVKLPEDDVDEKALEITDKFSRYDSAEFFNSKDREWF